MCRPRHAAPSKSCSMGHYCTQGHAAQHSSDGATCGQSLDQKIRQRLGHNCLPVRSSCQPPGHAQLDHRLLDFRHVCCSLRIRPNSHAAVESSMSACGAAQMAGSYQPSELDRVFNAMRQRTCSSIGTPSTRYRVSTVLSASLWPSMTLWQHLLWPAMWRHVGRGTVWPSRHQMCCTV